MEHEQKPAADLGSVESKWGATDAEHFGYASDGDRKLKRGLEDWELVEKIPESQKPVPYWFFAIVGVVLLVGVGLSFPFWGLRPGDTRRGWIGASSSPWSTSRSPARSSGTWSACTVHSEPGGWTRILRS